MEGRIRNRCLLVIKKRRMRPSFTGMWDIFQELIIISTGISLAWLIVMPSAFSNQFISTLKIHDFATFTHCLEF